MVGTGQVSIKASLFTRAHAEIVFPITTLLLLLHEVMSNKSVWSTML
jgi:hypothetical protein